jgi:hypothetical protein
MYCYISIKLISAVENQCTSSDNDNEIQMNSDDPKTPLKREHSSEEEQSPNDTKKIKTEADVKQEPQDEEQPNNAVAGPSHNDAVRLVKNIETNVIFHRFLIYVFNNI